MRGCCESDQVGFHLGSASRHCKESWLRLVAERWCWSEVESDLADDGLVP